MGYETIVLLNNDKLHDYRNNAQELVDHICLRAGCLETDERFSGYKQVNIPVIQHSSVYGLLAFGHNQAFPVVYDHSMHIPIWTLDGQVKLLESAAKKLGYKLIKKPGYKLKQ